MTKMIEKLLWKTAVVIAVLVAILLVVSVLSQQDATVVFTVPAGTPNPTESAAYYDSLGTTLDERIFHGAYVSSTFRFTLAYASSHRTAVCLSEVQGFPGLVVGLPELPMVTLVFEGDRASMYDISEIDLESAMPEDFLGKYPVVSKILTGMDFPVEFFVTAYDESGEFAGNLSVSVDDC